MRRRPIARGWRRSESARDGASMRYRSRRRRGGGLDGAVTARGVDVGPASGPIDATAVVLATGGRSVPKTGSDGHGYTIARSLGHTITETFPGLVPLIIDEVHWMRELSGTSAEVEI